MCTVPILLPSYTFPHSFLLDIFVFILLVFFATQLECRLKRRVAKSLVFAPEMTCEA